MNLESYLQGALDTVQALREYTSTAGAASASVLDALADRVETLLESLTERAGK